MRDNRRHASLTPRQTSPGVFRHIFRTNPEEL